MSIKCNLSTLMGKHKMTIQDVCNHEKQNAISFKTLNKLCDLFNCTTLDIIEYMEDEKDEPIN